MEPQEGTPPRQSAADASRGKRRRAMRVIYDQNRMMILVYEVEPAVGESGPHTLVFEWGKSTAELENFPSYWKDLSDDGLLQLLKH